MNTFWLLGLTALAVWIVWTYNRLVRARNQQAESWSGVDVQLKKRTDLVPALVQCVAAYRTHEASTQIESAAARTATDPVVGEMRGLLAVAEAYPELKAGENFRKLMQDLSAIEDDLQFARRYYNGSVRDFRNLAESVPSNLVAGMFRFQPGEFFEVESVLERSSPQVEL